MNTKQSKFLNQYLSTLTKDEREGIPAIDASHFCSDEENANKCAKLILSEGKRASCSLKKGYEIEKNPLPKIGQLTVALDWNQNPVCIIKLTSISFCPFNQVSEDFARLEGEGDGSYNWWRDEHIRFFTRYAQEIGTEFTESDELVLETFKKVYPF